MDLEEMDKSRKTGNESYIYKVAKGENISLVRANALSINGHTSDGVKVLNHREKLRNE